MTAPSQLISLDEFDESINMLIYADSGVGKTVLAGTMPRGLIIACEPGTISAKRQGSKVKVWKVETWNDVELAYQFLEDNPEMFDWVSIDSLTAMQELMLRWILNRANEKNSERDLDIPAIQDHQKWQNMLKRWVNDFNDLPVNVLWTALSMRQENEDGEDLVLPLLLGKGYQISASICGKMHAVGYMKVASVKDKTTQEVKQVRKILFKNVTPFFAKDRYNCLADKTGWMRDPSIGKIQQFIEESGTDPLDPEDPQPDAPSPARKTREAARAKARTAVKEKTGPDTGGPDVSANSHDSTDSDVDLKDLV